MPRLAFTWTVSINAPVEHVFDYLRDPENAFRAQGGGDPCIDVCDIEETPEGVGSTGRNVFPLPGLGRFGIRGSVTNEIVEVVPNRRIVVRTSPSTGRLFKFEGTWTWTFEPANGGTKLTLDYAEWANWLVYVFDRATEELQTRGFGEAVATWVESALRARDASPG